MDARVEWEGSQRPSSIKRHWDDDTTLAEKTNGWGATLPPIDPVSYHKPQVPHRTEPAPTSHIRYGRESIEPGPKRPRYDWNEHNGEKAELNGKLPHSRPTHSVYPHNSSGQGSLGSPSFLQKQQRREAWERQGVDPVRPPAPQETMNLCRRCKKLLNQDTDILESCEDCKRDPELAYITQAAAAGLTQLAETLSSGISSDQRGVIRSPEREALSADCPALAQSGLKQTLDWILGRIHQINNLADNLVQHVPQGALPKPRHSFPQNGIHPREALTDTMKRRVDPEPDNGFRPRPDAPGLSSDALLHERRTSSVSREDLPSIRSQYDLHQSHPLDGPSRRNIMNPPPAPATNLQLPSPPRRSLSSPTSINFPSPSAVSYGSTSQPVNLPPPFSSYLPPISSGQSSDTALQTHTAALQHEVSVQKIAFSSLQGEHDKLLAAYSRSQTRASALEKKHNVSDAEIISLTEEKLRLQSQVIELERDVEDLSRSRDECRQSAVQEGAQYVEIVRQASQLEERTAEERKSWAILKTEMEKKIQALNNGGHIVETGPSNEVQNQPIADSTETPASPLEPPPILKIEPMSEPLNSAEVQSANNIPAPEIAAPPPPPEPNQDSTAEELHQEIRRLQSRCVEMEDTLRTVREESRSMEEIVEALGLAGKKITDKANSALEIESSD